MDKLKDKLLPTSAGPNNIVADWRVIRAAEAPFSQLATAADFLCMFSTFEALVLYDDIWVHPSDIEECDVLQPFINDGVIKVFDGLSDQIPPDKPREPLVELFRDLRFGDLRQLSTHGFTDEAYESAYARYFQAESLGMDCLADPVLNAYMPHLEYEIRRAQLAKLYDVISDEYHEILHNLGSVATPKKMFIPPVPAVTLHRATTNYGVIHELRALRDEFKPYREKYRAYQRTINDDTLAIKDRDKALQQSFSEVGQALRQVTLKSTAARLITEDTTAIIKSANLSADLESVSLKLTAPLEILAKFAVRQTRMHIVKRRARALFDLWDAAVAVSGYSKLLSRHFDFDDDTLEQDITSAAKLRDKLDQYK